MHRFFGRAYDANGEIAAKGAVNDGMLTDLLQHPFFQRPIPRCAWRLDFGADYADQMLDKYSAMSPEDLVATLTQFTAAAIATAFTELIPQVGEIHTLIASGGGVRNATLLKAIAALLPDGVRLVISDEYGLPAQYKEAIKFATLAYATQRAIGDNIPAASGAVRFGILGKLVQAPRGARLTEI
jgi:anhydro-N-acetylmuramic acid kinase